MIIGITGTLGAGKGSVVEYLKSKGFVHIAVSETFLVGEALKRGLEPTRIVRHDIANEYRSKGPEKLMEAVYALAVDDIVEGKDVVVEPQHTPEEVLFIKSKHGIVLAVDADLEVRFERIRKRGGPKDNVSFDEFKAHQMLEMRPTATTNNNLEGAIAAADYIILNNGSLEELHQEIEKLLTFIHAR